ncbi:hypothetical protein ACRALDRAFT_2098697 [Sodiomyces alcalophilus JCM 7366]|uniref:uncharacterized protein n=1 Tax=Sodiomyces alcalophilus JCM 7366 TaxID=591952 RepID=UPI0039B465B9
MIASDQLSVSLNVISPSTAVATGPPLSFPGLPASTTVRQLKEKIRNLLPTKPTDAQQWLIYKGRVLQQDDETLCQVIGESTIRAYNLQTIHLVLRGLPDIQPPTAPSFRGRSPASSEHRTFESYTSSLPASRQQSPHYRFGPSPSPGPSRRNQGGDRDALPGFVVPNAPTFTSQQVHQMQSQLSQTMSAWNNGLQREAINRAIAHQQLGQTQPARGTTGSGSLGIGEPSSSNPIATPSDAAARGRTSPGAHPYTRTFVREGALSDGQPYRATNNETWAPLSAAEVQNILRGADAGQATQAMTDAMQRSDPGLSSGNASQGHNPATSSTPFYQSLGSRAGSRGATPDPTTRSTSAGGTAPTTNAAHRGAPPSGPEVYILSSPEGPRALLINSSSEMYYTPAGRSPLPQLASSFPPLGGQLRHGLWPLSHLGTPSGHHENNTQQVREAAPSPQVPQPQPQQQQQQQKQQQQQQRQRQQRPQGPQQNQQQNQQQNEVQQQQPRPQGPQHPQQQNQAQPAAAPAHAHNPAIAPVVAQMWPHFWLLIRLAVFVWWFTAPSASWSRWATVLGIAICIFLINTGLLNGMFDQAAGPVRRHMDNLIPLAQPNHARNAVPAPPGDGQPAIAAAQNTAGPDPMHAAARMVADRRQANTNWFVDQVRRVERAGLLFLASIAPGVAERHIAQVEAEERAEQQRREEAAAAAAAAATETQGDSQPTNPEGNPEMGRSEGDSQDRARDTGGLEHAGHGAGISQQDARADAPVAV